MTRTSERAASRGVRAKWRRAWRTRRAGAQLLSTPFRRELSAAYGDVADLRPVSGRPPLREYLTGLYDRRHFMWAGARGAALTRFSGERLGALWYIIRPILDAVFYGVIFGVVLQISRDMENYIAWVVVGVFMFQLTSRAIVGGASLIRGSKAMLRAFSFPRASLAVSLTLRELIMELPAMCIMFLGIMLIPPHEAPGVTWLLFPVVLALHTALNLGITLLFGWLGAVLPDISQAMSFVTRILLYGSAVLFPIGRFDEFPIAKAMIEANPIYIVLTMYREILIDNAVPAASEWIALAAWAFGALLVGATVFWLDEERYTRD